MNNTKQLFPRRQTVNTFHAGDKCSTASCCIATSLQPLPRYTSIANGEALRMVRHLPFRKYGLKKKKKTIYGEKRVNSTSGHDAFMTVRWNPWYQPWTKRRYASHLEPAGLLVYEVKIKGGEGGGGNPCTHVETVGPTSKLRCVHSTSSVQLTQVHARMLTKWFKFRIDFQRYIWVVIQYPAW